METMTNIHQDPDGGRSTTSSSTMLAKRLHNILSLPTEVLQNICYQMNAQTFAVALMTCKAFRSAGLSRSVLLRHLGTVLGWRKELKDLTADELFDLFGLRITTGLHSAGVFADITIHKLIGGSSLAKAVISCNNGDYLATVGRSGVILVYRLFRDGVELESRLWPKDSSFDPDSHELIKIAFSTSGDIAALYKPESTDTVSSHLPLFTFQRKLTGLRREETRIWNQERRDLEYEQNSQPTGLAMAPDRTVCVAWTNSDWKGSTKFMLYIRDGHETYGSQSSK